VAPPGTNFHAYPLGRTTVNMAGPIAEMWLDR
jgi:hypothetical protein